MIKMTESSKYVVRCPIDWAAEQALQPGQQAAGKIGIKCLQMVAGETRGGLGEIEKGPFRCTIGCSVGSKTLGSEWMEEYYVEGKLEKRGEMGLASPPVPPLAALAATQPEQG